MSTISYKCDTCKRDVELLENSRGLTVFSKCVITDGCKGRLYVTGRNPDGFREVFPSDVPDLEEYTSRRAFVEFKQEILSKVWKVKHDMSIFPAVTVYFTDGNVTSEVSADDYIINLLSNNTLELLFELPSKGVVHLVARSTVPLSPETIPDEADLIQISKNGTLTFAMQKLIDTGQSDHTDMFLIDSSLEVCLQAPNQEPIICTEVIPHGITFGSPWISWDEILVRNRRQYYPRSKNVLDFSVYQGTLYNITDIEDGTTLAFKRIIYDNSTGTLEAIEPRKLFLLMSAYPHESIDKIVDQLIDVSELGSESPNFLTFKGGELFADKSAIEVVYPDISKYVVIPAPPTPTPSPTPPVTLTPTMTPTSTPTPTPTPTMTPSEEVTPLTVAVTGPTDDFCENLIEITITFSAPVTIVGGFYLEDVIIFDDSEGAAFPFSAEEDSPGVFLLEFSTNDSTIITVTVPAGIATDVGLNTNSISNAHVVDVAC